MVRVPVVTKLVRDNVVNTSKWNKIEHRLFSFISLNWRGQPLVSHEVIVNLIAATTTRKGLKVRAEIDPALYAKRHQGDRRTIRRHPDCPR